MTVEWLERQAEKRELAELRVLATALARQDLADQTIPKVEASLFRRESHRMLADALWSLRREGRPAGVEEVADRLIGRQQLELVGGFAGLYDLLRYAEPSLEAVEDLLRIERRRSVYQTCMEGARNVTNPDREPNDVAAEVFGRLRETQAEHFEEAMSTDELLAMPHPTWLIEGMFPQGLNVMFGSPKSGKSYLALTIAWSIATGSNWFSRTNKGLPEQVLYLAGEGLGDLRLRAESLLESTGKHPGRRLAWWPERLSLSKDSDSARLRLEVERLDARLIVVDTWARYAGVRDENDAAQTQAALSTLEALTLEGRSVLVVHHASKQGAMRGSSAMAGAVESAVRVEINDDDGLVRLSSEMSRRGSGFRDMHLGWTRIGPDSVLTEATVI